MESQVNVINKTEGNTEDWMKNLSPNHLQLIKDSSISNEVARDRGYRSALKKADVKKLGFADSQSLVPALLIPIRSVTGEICSYQLRPDMPRTKDGKALKYETPSKSRMHLDVPPKVRRWLGDPARPLFITEGVRKADAAASRDLCCIALLGVWNFRGTNECGGKTVLPDWEFIALNDREVYIVFDSDVMLKEEVHDAMSRLSGFLKKKKAKVRFIYLPAGKGGTKTGLDDYFAEGYGVNDLLARASSNLRDLPAKRISNNVPYIATPNGFIWIKSGSDGSTEVQLTNFTAKITGEQIQDDGQDQKRIIEVEVNLKNAITRFKISSAEFASLKWVNAHLGPAAIIYPGFSLSDHTRTAIQQLSEGYPTSKVYAHLGWRKIDGKWFYLHAGGSIGPEDGTVNQSGWPNEMKRQEHEKQIDTEISLVNGTVGTGFKDTDGRENV